MEFVTLRDEHGAVIANFTPRAGLEVINLCKGSWYTTRAKKQAFRVSAPQMVSINGDVLLHVPLNSALVVEN